MFIRNPFLTRSVTLFIGIMFLNLSFIMTEVKFLELEKNNRSLFENLMRIASGSGIEEEKDATGESSNELKGDLTFYIHLDAKSLHSNYQLTINLHGDNTAFKLLNTYREIFSPPPDTRLVA